MGRRWIPSVVKVLVGGLAVALIAIALWRETASKNTPAPTSPSSLAGETRPDEPREPVSVPKPGRQANAKNGGESVAGAAGVDSLLEGLVDDVVQSVQPLRWTRVKFDNKAEFFSEADLSKARRVVARYFENFEKIQSVRCTHTQTCTLRADSPLAEHQEARDRVTAHNFALQVEATRAPLFLRVTGKLGDQDQIDETITPAGKLTKGQSAMGYSESLLPRYLDGEEWFLEAVLLKYGDRVRENVTMDVAIPPSVVEMQGRDLRNTFYDVVEDAKDDVGMTNSYWFNRETGMLDFVITERQRPGKNEEKVFSVSVIDYAKVGETYYPSTAVCYDYDFELTYRQKITDLVLQARKEVR